MDTFGWSGLKRLGAIGRSLWGREVEKLGSSEMENDVLSLHRSRERKGQKTGTRRASE